MTLAILFDSKLVLKRLISTFILKTEIIISVLFLDSYCKISRTYVTSLYLLLYKVKVLRVILAVEIVTIKLFK